MLISCKSSYCFVIVKHAVRALEAGDDALVQRVPLLTVVVAVICPPAFPIRPVDVWLGVAVDVEVGREPSGCLVEFAAVDRDAEFAAAVWARRIL